MSHAGGVGQGADTWRGEHRWPMAVAVLAVATMHALLPPELRLVTSSWLPWASAVILAVLVFGDPGRVNSLKTWVRVLTDVLIAILTLSNAYAAVMLVVGIVQNASFETPAELLFAGAVVWLSNVICFALWFWDLDRGGPAERAAGTGRAPAFVFPEMTHTSHVGPNWQPTFVDYLTYSFSTATAFSPTDVSAVKPWAKLLVVLESLVSLALAMLVIARAVNILN